MWGSLQAIVEEQYALAKKCNISLLESNLLPDFERQIHINLLMKDMEEERKAIQGN